MNLDYIVSHYFFIPISISVVVYFIIWALKNVVISRLRVVSAKTDNIIDDIVLNVLQQTKNFFMLSISLFAGFQSLKIDETHGYIADRIIIVIIAVQAIIWSSEAVKSWAEITIARKNDDPSLKTSMGFIQIILKFVLIVAVILFALNNLGVNITTFIAGLGVGGIAIALATQNILGDLFSSLSIVLDKPFIVGDSISLGEWQGTIENIGLKTTRIRSINGEQIVVSNSDLLSSKIRNFKRMDERRVVFTLGLTYDAKRSDLRKAKSLVEEIIKKYPKTRFDRAHFLKYAASSLDIEVVYIFLSPDFAQYADTHESILLDINDAFAENNLEFAFPTQTLIVQNQKT
jgi:small-conductance mechanosensitive channel